MKTDRIRARVTHSLSRWDGMGEKETRRVKERRGQSEKVKSEFALKMLLAYSCKSFLSHVVIATEAAKVALFPPRSTN